MTTQTNQQNQNAVPTLMRAAFQAAGHRAVDQADLAAAAIAGLRKLRHVLAEQAGPDAARQVVDGPVSSFILERNLRALSVTGTPPAPAPLPASLALAGPAAALMLDAVQNGLILQKFLPGNAALTQMVPELMESLCGTLGGTPDAGSLLTVLGAGAKEGEPALPVEGPGSQRLH